MGLHAWPGSQQVWHRAQGMAHWGDLPGPALLGLWVQSPWDLVPEHLPQRWFFAFPSEERLLTLLSASLYASNGMSS